MDERIFVLELIHGFFFGVVGGKELTGKRRTRVGNGTNICRSGLRRGTRRIIV